MKRFVVAMTVSTKFENHDENLKENFFITNFDVLYNKKVKIGKVDNFFLGI